MTLLARLLGGFGRGPPEATLGGLPVTLAEAAAHVIASGTTGAGKSYSLEPFLEDLIRLDAPMLVTGVKPDEINRWKMLTTRAGHAHRFVVVRPGGPHRLNLAAHLMAAGGEAHAADFLERLTDLALKASGRSEDQFWKMSFREMPLNCLRLLRCAGLRFTLADVVDLARAAPASPRAAARVRTDQGLFAAVLRTAEAAKTPDNEHDLERAKAYFLTEWPNVGTKVRGIVLSMVAGSLGLLTAGPFRELLCTEETTLDPRRIEDERLVVYLDYPVLRYHAAGQLVQAAFVQACQEHCLARDPAGVDRPFILVRDEVQYTLHANFDMKVQTVARSQKLMMFDIVQSINVLKGVLGGKGAEDEALAFWANHSVKIMFANSSAEHNRMAAEVIGRERQVYLGGGSGGGEADTPGDRLLGVRPGRLQWSEQLQYVLEPGTFASLPRGVCVLTVDGKRFGGRPYLICDLRRG